MMGHKLIETLNMELSKKNNTNEFLISNVKSILRNIKDESDWIIMEIRDYLIIISL